MTEWQDPQKLYVGETNWPDLHSNGWRFSTNIPLGPAANNQGGQVLQGLIRKHGVENVAVGNAWRENAPIGIGGFLGLYVRELAA